MIDHKTIITRPRRAPRKPDPKAVERRKRLEAVMERKKKLDELL